MIGIKDQCFGVEIELTGITRAEAAEALAAYFETTPQRSYEKMEKFQECVRRIRQAGGKVNDCVVITIQEVNMRWGVFASEQIHFCDNTIESCDNRHFVIPLSDPNISRYRDNVKRCYKRGR